jgi:hypothetical protein
MKPPCREDEADLLYMMGELSTELAELMPRWREDYEKVWQPGFAYCIGHAKPGDTSANWLESAPARRAYLRWAGFPREIIKRWEEERKRRAKTIRMLA